MRSEHMQEQLAWLRNHQPKQEQKPSSSDARLWGMSKTANNEDEKDSVAREAPNLCGPAYVKDPRMKQQ
ncbi:hypothetical protein EXIGLDRAFT_761975 [Exidia glandulosa HHB12029]|uniref:Uncharacterized protein n=1 Tax=Exidia glandulosa HHB12029 TaxID=1314781 RepID=A0A166BDB6_EXIGL|nr:hypothetical protein EXIGLDRAFT_761975 [Exidia glandulosa HHB12029]